jgi:hypothetical protein
LWEKAVNAEKTASTFTPNITYGPLYYIFTLIFLYVAYPAVNLWLRRCLGCQPNIVIRMESIAYSNQADAVIGPVSNYVVLDYDLTLTKCK